MIAINDIRVAIQQALDSIYPNIDVYSEEIKQGFDEPCFFIKSVNSNQDNQMWNSKKREILFDIHYFSDKEEDINKDCLDMADSLYKILELIDIEGKKFRANKMNHRIEDNVLHFQLKFSYKILRIIQSAKMKKVEVKVNGR